MLLIAAKSSGVAPSMLTFVLHDGAETFAIAEPSPAVAAAATAAECALPSEVKAAASGSTFFGSAFSLSAEGLQGCLIAASHCGFKTCFAYSSKAEPAPCM